MVVVGIDEAGRGAFFSRIYSAAVVYMNTGEEDKNKKTIVIRDSKKMTPRQRSVAHDYLIANVQYGIGYCDQNEIDDLGITRCNINSMHRALDDLTMKYPNLVIDKINVDGMLFMPWKSVPYETIVRGEDSHKEIAMASILAKKTRDNFVLELCRESPELQEKYDIGHNKGYGTAKHREGLRKHGSHRLHRKSFVRSYDRFARFL